MHILILGAAGMLGRKIAAALCTTSQPGLPVTRLTLADVVEPVARPFAGRIETVALDFASPGAAGRLLAGRPDIIIHLAAVVSAEAEADFDKGYAVNLDASRALLEAVRQMPDYFPRVVFASSTAVFGVPFPDPIPDDFHLTPRSSYGAQKAATELLLNDYIRRGFLDGIALRLPTICIRPGLPNKAASGFYSNILREPLNGRPAVLPVPDSIRHWFASPRSAVGFFLHAAVMDLAKVGPNRAINMPGLSATVADQIAALRKVAGQSAVDLIRAEPDAAIAAIVETWPTRFDTVRATALGFVAEQNFDQILKVYIEDEM
jgi:nucleoside-diphosphate-sugar epimerase